MNTDFSLFKSIQIDKENKLPLYAQLYDQLQQLICEQKLSEGFLLPPVRKFADFLGINAGTVTSAYRKLEQNGYIYTKVGSGNYVAELHNPSAAASSLAIPSENELTQTDGCINLSSLSLNPELISIEAIKNIFIEVLDRDKGYAFSYQDSQGFLPLRESIAANLKKTNIHITADNVQIISGAQQGIDLTAKALLNYGDYVFVETPTYPGALAAFRSRGAKIIDIPLTSDGINIDALETKLKLFRPKLMYVMPNIQNPTGITYSTNTRNRLMGLARYYNVTILEDDYISDLHYTDEMMAPLKSIDRDDRIIYMKSFSKIFMPGLRIAFLITTPKLAPALSAAKVSSDIATSGLTQRVFDLYLRHGVWRDHINSICLLYKERFHIMLDALQNNLPSTVKYIIPHGGMSFWLELPSRLSAAQIIAKARQHNVLLTAGNDFFARQPKDRYLRISFATASAKEIQTGIKILSQLIKEK